MRTPSNWPTQTVVAAIIATTCATITLTILAWYCAYCLTTGTPLFSIHPIHAFTPKGN